jgi:hypothetical protein
MMNQLEYFRSELNLHLTFEVRQVLQKNQTLQLTKDDVRAVLDKISQLESSLADIRLHFNNDSKTRQTEVLHAVSTLVAENSVLHARSTQRSIESHAAITGGMDSLKQMVHTQHLESMDYLARAEVKNTQFFATMTVERASLEDSIENVLRPLLEEYRDSLLQETRKEFRGTARAQIEELLTGLTRNMDLQDCSHLKDRFSYSPEHEEQQSCYATMSTDLMPSQLQPCGINNDESEKIKKHKDRKAGWALLYKHWLEKKTRIGTFLLLVRHTTQLRTGQPPLSVFALEAHFVPNLFWLSTGRSIMYQRIQDGRGSPKFGFQFPVYRVLGSDHEVWGSIYLGNLDAVQAMLSQKSILPSDRDEAGWTLLHVSHTMSIE